jgi:hypothetical protein
MEKENQKYERQKNIIGFGSKIKVISQPLLNEIDGAAFEPNQIRMDGVRFGWRPLLNGINCRDLSCDISTEKRKDNLERNRSSAFEMPPHANGFYMSIDLPGNTRQANSQVPNTPMRVIISLFDL